MKITNKAFLLVGGISLGAIMASVFKLGEKPDWLWIICATVCVLNGIFSK